LNFKLPKGHDALQISKFPSRLIGDGVKTITTITEYCKEINISSPKHALFDIRKFEDNAKTVNLKQPPLRHEFYAIALRNSGGNSEVNGSFLDCNLFFNSPYQIITWDIKPDWQGWYIIFDQEFISLNPSWQNFIIDFPFFRLDKASPMNLPEEYANFVNDIFKQIYDEYHSENKDKFLFIQNYTQLLLLITKRHFDNSTLDDFNNQDNRATDILLVSRFQSLVETMLTDDDSNSKIRQPSFYADKLTVHPNHLNAVVKRITGKTATSIIQNQLVATAKSLLRQTELSVKQISFRLHFAEPTHFNSYFKKVTNLTPQQYREKHIL
jgi:AraC-like DNA-binding protein